jgi:predicted RND superfamily exporter protein
VLRRLYQGLILRYPKSVLAALLVLIALLGVGATKLEVDASAETLLLEDDKDLQFFREISERYPGGLNVLIISFAPKNGDLLSEESFRSIEKITDEFTALTWVDSVMSVMNVPLLENTDGGISELVNDVKTLRSPDVNMTRARDELLTSPMYSQNLVSKDLKTTAIVVAIKDDPKYRELLEKRNAARAVTETPNHTHADRIALEEAQAEFKAYRDEVRIREHNSVEEAREIIKRNEGLGKLFIGGVNMIAVDMITFVKSDLKQFGTALILLFAFALWLIFRQVRWVVIPLLVCILSIVATAGLLGIFGWEVTVISSNFIALQLILTISIVLHLIVRYRELFQKYPHIPNEQLMMLTILSKATPSFFAVFTTIIGFLSLMLSDIRPIINFGFMMSSGITLSLIITFIALPTIIMILPKKPLYTKFERDFALSSLCAKFVEKHGRIIVATSVVLVIVALVGISKIKVENSFISYFKSSTDIYQGMKNIDTNLGGTTPMDVIVHFKNATASASAVADEDDFESEFEADANDPKYWFTPQKTELATKLQNYFQGLQYMGKVQSLGTLLEIGQRINHGEPLDNFELALIYTQLPDQYRDVVLTPYVNIPYNELRFTMRLIDSDPHLERKKLLDKMQSDLAQMVPEDVAEFRQSGAMVLYNNLLQSLFSSQILTLGVVVLVFLVMFWPLFGSLKAALSGIASILMTMSVVFGFMGYAGIPLDLMTITIASITVGMGVDNVIHYIHRFKEELHASHDYVTAMYRSHNSIGYAMYYTTISTALGFAILVFSNFIPIVYFGLLTVCVMIMMFLGAILLLPRLLIIFKPFKC